MKSMSLAAVSAGIVVAAVSLWAAPARSLIPWPSAGAPVCTAPGDQSFLLHRPSACGGFMSFAWFDPGVGADTLSASYLDATPPTGGCPRIGASAGLGVREVGSARLQSGVLPGFPGCYEDPPSYAWIEGSGASERLVVAAWSWFGTVTADDGEVGSVRRSSLGLVGGESAGARDTSAVVVWTDNRTGPLQVRAQRVGESGARSWGDHGALVAPSGFAQKHPVITRLANGRTLIAWEDYRDGAGDIYAQLLLPDGTPAPGWPAAGRAMEARPEISALPRFARTALPWNTSPRLVWEERGGRFGSGRTLVVRAFDGAGDLDPAWSDSGVVLSTVNSVEHLQAVRGDDDGGGIAAVWTDTRAATPSNGCDLYAQRLRGDGSRPEGWLPGGVVICSAPGRQEDADIDAYASGVTTYAWVDRRSGGAQVYVGIRDPDGSMPCCLWQANGLPAGPGGGDQLAPVVEADNAGGLFVAWLDSRNAATTGVDVYAQAFTYDGSTADVPGAPRNRTSRFLPPQPNPAHGDVRLTLELANPGRVGLQILDVSGRVVRTLADESQPAGRQQWTWDGRDDEGRPAPAGLFFVHATADGTSSTHRLIHLR